MFTDCLGMAVEMADGSYHSESAGGNEPLFAAGGNYSCATVVYDGVHRQNEKHSQQLHVHLPEAGEDGATSGCQGERIPAVQWRSPEAGKERR